MCIHTNSKYMSFSLYMYESFPSAGQCVCAQKKNCVQKFKLRIEAS